MDSSGITILVIDDEAAVRRSIADHLEDMGYRTVMAENGRAGLDLLTREKADLVLVDLRMPEMDGLEVLGKITETDPEMPLIVVSGTGVIADAVEALHQGAWDYVLKPINDFSVLTHAIENALEKARLKRENRQYQQHLEQMVSERTKELRENEEKYRIITDNITDVITIFDSSGNITFTTPSHKRVMGRGTEVVGRSAFEHIHPEDKPKVKIYIEKAFEGGGAEQLEFRYLTPSRGYIWLEAIGKFIDMHGVSSCLVLLREITERRKAEEALRSTEMRLRQSQKMEAIGVLAGGIAHDFNNILSAVLGYAELAKLDLEDREKTWGRLDEIIGAGMRARDLVRQILTFARQADIKKAPVAVDHLMRETLKFLRASLPASIDIRQERSVTDAATFADPTQIHQVLMNLCANAAHAMVKNGGILDVRLEEAAADDPALKTLKPGRYLKLTVADTGCGIPGEVIDKIFDPFFTTKDRGEGTGMGLSVVHGIIEDMGGAISVHSKPGAGSTFHVFLPRYEGREMPAEGRDMSAGTGSGKILFVDDEKSIITVGRGILEHRGYQVAAASSPRQALSMFEAAPGAFDLVLTDMTMPEMTGIELSEKLLEIRPDIPIVLFTGFNPGITPEKVRAAGIRSLVMKPMVAGELVNAVQSALNADTD